MEWRVRSWKRPEWTLIGVDHNEKLEVFPPASVEKTAECRPGYLVIVARKDAIVAQPLNSIRYITSAGEYGMVASFYHSRLRCSALEFEDAGGRWLMLDALKVPPMPVERRFFPQLQVL